MKESEITVLKAEPGKHPVSITLDSDLDSLQKAVSIGASTHGLVEIMTIRSGIALLCDEKGKSIGLEGSRRVGHDVITGVFYVAGEDKQEMCN